MQVWLHSCWRAYTKVRSRQEVVRSNATVQGWVTIISPPSELLGLCVWAYICMSLYSFYWRVSTWQMFIVLTLIDTLCTSLYINTNIYNSYNSKGSFFSMFWTCFLTCEQWRISAQLFLQYFIHKFLYMNKILSCLCMMDKCCSLLAWKSMYYCKS